MPAAAPAGPPPSRLVRWCLGLAGLLALALIGVVVNYLAHGGTEELNPVAEAAEKTGTLPGGRLKLEVTYAVAGSSRSVSGTGGGVFDARSSRARVTLTEPGADGSPLRVQSVGDNRKIFIRSRVLAAELPAGKQWLGMEPLLGHDPSAAFGASGGAEGSLDMLKAVGGEVEKVGEETLRGGPTTRYKARLELSKAAQLLSEDGEAALAHEYSQFAEKVPAPIPVEVWIDETGLVRRFRMVEPLPSESGPTVTMDMRMEFFDFAAHPGIAFPPAGQVLDYTPVLRAELGMTNGGNVGSLEPPAGADPLSPADFRRRADGICRATLAQGRHVFPAGRRILAELSALGRPAMTTPAGRSVLVRLGRWLEAPVYHLGVDEISRLAAIAPPPADAQDYRHYLRIYAQQAEWALARARAFQLGVAKIPGTEGQAAEEARWKTELKHLADRMGIQECEKKLGPAAPSQAA